VAFAAMTMRPSAAVADNPGGNARAAPANVD
jgi:hypothetical protein